MKNGGRVGSPRTRDDLSGRVQRARLPTSYAAPASRGMMILQAIAMDTSHLPSGDALADLCRRWRIRELSVFGSAARASSRIDSDVDLLVTFDPDAPWSTLDIV